MSEMIAIKVISVFLLMEVMMSGVISQTIQSTIDSNQTGADYGEYDDSSQASGEASSEVPAQPTEVPAQPPTTEEETSLCTDFNNPPTKQVWNTECKDSYCDCLDPQKKGCPQQWSGNFLNGLANKYKINNFPWCDFDNTWWQNSIKRRGNMLRISFAAHQWSPYYFNQIYDISDLAKGPLKQVRYPDTFHKRDMYLNTSYFGPKVNTKGMWYLKLLTFNPELIDNKIRVLSADQKMLYYPSYYQFTDPTDPLFDTLILGPLHNYYRVWWQTNRYSIFNKSNKVEFQAISFDDSFDMKSNPKPKMTQFLRAIEYCIGSKINENTGRMYWTGEGCRPTIKYSNDGSKTDIGFNHLLDCECDFESVGFEIPPPKPTITKPVLKPVEGFNTPDGTQPQGVISANSGTYWSKFIACFIFAFNVLFLVSAIGVTLYFIFYKKD